MKTKTRSASMGVLAAAAMLIALPTAAAAADVSFAGGHGNLISGGELRTFSFTAVRDAAGAVRGAVQVKNRALDVRAHIEVDCVRFEGEARAIVSGTITHSSDPAGLIVPGRIGVFGVEDNGEGRDAPVDRITTIPDYAEKSCHDFTFVDDTLREVGNPDVTVRTLMPILAGNVQVLP
jgi:hypothetical protein